MVAGGRNATTLARSVADAIIDADRLALPVALVEGATIALLANLSAATLLDL